MSQSFDKFFIYSIFLFLGLNIKIIPGFYIYNLLILFFLAARYKKLIINKQAYVVLLVFSIGVLITTIIQIFYIDTFNLSNYYVVFNIPILASYLFFIKQIDFGKLYYPIVLFLIALPLLLSILMFFNSGIEQFLLSFYNLGAYPAFGRYGGIFGEDVNTLGIYASLLLLMSMLLYKYQKIGLILVIFFIQISLSVIIISGMRTGLLVLFGLLLIYSKLKMFDLKLLLLNLFLLFAVLLILYIYSEYSQPLIDYFMNRFSISHIVQGLLPEGGGNMEHAIGYFYRTIDGLEFNWYTVLFSPNPSLTFLDNFYIFLFLKNGILGVLFFVVLSIYTALVLIWNQNHFGLYLLLVTLLLAFKGIFILSNFYMLFILFMMQFVSKSNKSLELQQVNN